MKELANSCDLPKEKAYKSRRGGLVAGRYLFEGRQVSPSFSHVATDNETVYLL